MKKTVFSLALAAVATVGMAQSPSMEAFKHMGVGVEVGLMGLGVEVSVPVVTDHLVLVAGYNLYGIKPASYDLNFSADEYNNSVRNMFDDNSTEIALYNLRRKAGDTPLTYDNCRLDEGFNITAKLGLASNAKVLLEYYPWATHTFHITAGMMIGNEEFLTLKGTAAQDMQDCYNLALEVQDNLQHDGVISSDKDYVRGTLNYNIDDATYGIKDKLEVDARIAVNKVKPYLGIGFGRAIPEKRVGFQFEVGAWYHGEPSIVSDNRLDAYNPDASGMDGVDDVLSKIQIWPQLTFRLTGRIF